MGKAPIFFCALGIAIIQADGSIRAALPGGLPQEAASDRRLARILARTKDYCRRLENAALDFVCIEDIKEEFFHLPGIEVDTVEPGHTPRWPFSYRIPRKGFVRTFIHDYQLIRKDGQRVETRTLIKENGIPRNEKNAQLTTMSVRVENALFGPVGLLSEARQAAFEYRLAGEKKVEGRKALLVDAIPKPEFPGVHCNGRIWILEGDASIVKIEWEQTSVGNYRAIRETAERLKAEPSLVSATEYDVLKNGIRFPSRDTTEESYLMKKNKKFVRSKSTILYRDYRFFSVETDVRVLGD